MFLLDEFGGVTPDAEGRCDVMLRRALLDHVDLPPVRYHRPDPEAPDVDAMCDDYESRLGSGLDLALLGIGTNGHIGMNEPGTPPDSPYAAGRAPRGDDKASARYFGSGPLPTWGVTVGLRVLLASRMVWLLAGGESKADIVREIVEGDPSPDLPASLLRGHPDCWLFVDEAAAARLAVA